MSTGAVNPFVQNQATTALAVSTVSASMSFNQPTDVLRLYNSGSAVIFIVLGENTSGLIAATTGFPLAPGVVEYIGVPMTIKALAAVLGNGSGTLYITPGNGTQH